MYIYVCTSICFGVCTRCTIHTARRPFFMHPFNVTPSSPNFNPTSPLHSPQSTVHKYYIRTEYTEHLGKTYQLVSDDTKNCDCRSRDQIQIRVRGTFRTGKMYTTQAGRQTSFFFGSCEWLRYRQTGILIINLSPKYITVIMLQVV